MKILVVSICSLALASVAVGAQKDEKKSQPKKQAQTAQHAAQPTHAAGAGAPGKKASTATHQGQNSRNAHTATAANDRQKGKKNESSTAVYEGQKGKKTQTSTTAYDAQKGKKNQTQVERQTKPARGGQVNRTGKPTETTTATTAGQIAAAKGKAAQGKPLKPQHFNVPKQPNTANAPPVKFQQGRQIEGSQNWQGQQYTVFRNYRSE